jgi:hypothetical protein
VSRFVFPYGFSPDILPEKDKRDSNSLHIFQPTLDDYDDVPVEEFGAAMLRGMGMTETELQEIKKKWVPEWLPYDDLLLDSAPNIGPLISRWELDKFKLTGTEAIEPPKS